MRIVAGSVTFPIACDRSGRAMAIVGAMPSRWRVTITDDAFEVDAQWWFRMTAPRSAIASVTVEPARTISRGVHGWRGRWLVNGAGRPLVIVRFDVVQRGHSMAIPITVRELTLSISEPESFVAELR
jgi:hypothetical protein